MIGFRGKVISGYLDYRRPIFDSRLPATLQPPYFSAREPPVLSSVLRVFRHHTASIMRVYKDIFTGDEMFCDSYKMKLVDDVVYEVYGKHVTRKHGDVRIDGANPSAEEADEGTDEAVESGVDIILNQRLQECYAFGDKKSFTGYLKDYMKRLVTKLQETKPDEVDVFKSNIQKFSKELLGKFKDLQFYTGESMDPEAMVAILDYKDVNGEEVPVMYFFKHGLLEEKY